MSDAIESVSAGPYVVGEIPPPLQYQFQDSNGLAIDLTGHTVKFSVREQYGTATEYDAVLSDAANGIVQYAWTGGEFPTAGSYRSEFWAGNGTIRYASILIEFDVRLPVGPVPTV